MTESNEVGEARTVKSAYPANSHKAKEQAKAETTPEKKVEKVITGEVKQRKKPLGKRVAETFTGDDAKNVGNYILFDVVLPSIKDLVFDAVKEGLQRAMYGDTGKGRSRPVQRPGSGLASGYTSYNRMGGGPSVPKPGDSFGVGGRRDISRRAREVHDFDEIVLETRGEAELVLERLGDLISNYGSATVADLLSMVGVTGSFTDDKWGWYDISQARAMHVREGFMLDLPKTEVIQ